MPNPSKAERGEISESIPLQRIDSTQERCEKEKLRQLFNQYDKDNNGYLDRKELKRLIKAQQCSNLPPGISKQILKESDVNNDNHLDFDEFYEMSKKHTWLSTKLISRYCELIVPTTHGHQPDDDDDEGPDRIACGRLPITMVLFSLVEIIAFLYDIFMLNDHREKDFGSVGLSTKGPAARIFIYDPYRRDQAWRFMSYMFVHVGVRHLLPNLIIQIFLGIALERAHCWWRVAIVYLAGVVAGSMGTSLTSPKVYLAGASGGVYALITAHIATFIMNWNEMKYVAVQLFVFLTFCTVDLGTSIYSHINNKNDQIGYIAHLSGAIAGLLIGIGVLRNLKVLSWEKVIWWCAVTIFFVLMLLGMYVHIFIPSNFPPPRPTVL